MNNKEYIAELAERAGYTQTDTQQMVRTIVETMSAAFEAGDTVQVSKFGSFDVKKRLERIIVNPGTKQRMLVPPKLVLSFKPIVAIKEDLKNT
ncbi:MAG TPA: HU family DNA-binding protein [Prevotella sp.]|jgi:nucleoid DNA-binding protein|nr:HU family DNA-binding protein [Prevotella sp.]HCN54075.1 HU family DNA-binding protein [Prevotella sp.]